ncbi:hypothetical protein CYY_005155 [Polysphondylium violaceum]|uniref:Uncharacterized protein n=1 Tax=Polysphondylium violaceum TaxID=133409 RepID=A0A8J4PU83_9MYCE|nr:hypothetical protein CYY_005155 [Polysphondylium violaceum]
MSLASQFSSERITRNDFFFHDTIDINDNNNLNTKTLKKNSNNDKEILFKKIFNNVVLRNHIFKYFKPPRGYYIYYNGVSYKDDDDMNLDDILKTKDQFFISDKLARYRNIIENSSSSNSSTHTYYKDWLDYPSKIDAKHNIFIQFDDKEKEYEIYRDLFQLFINTRRVGTFAKQIFFSDLLGNVGLKTVSKFIKLSIRDQYLEIKSPDGDYGFFSGCYDPKDRDDIDICLSLKGGDEMLLHSTLFGGNQEIDVQVVKQILLSSQKFNYDLRVKDIDQEVVVVENILDVNVIVREGKPFFISGSQIQDYLVCLIRDFFPCAVKFLTTGTLFTARYSTKTRVVLDIYEYDVAVEVVDQLIKENTRDNLSYIINVVSEDIRILMLFTNEKNESPNTSSILHIDFPDKMVASIDNLEFFIDNYPERLSPAKILENKYIKDIFTFTRILDEMTHGELVKDLIDEVYLMAVAGGNIEFMQYYLDCDPETLMASDIHQQDFFIDIILLGYLFDTQPGNPVYRYLASYYPPLFSKTKISPQRQRYYQESLFCLAIIKLDVGMAKAIYAPLDDTQKERIIKMFGMVTWPAIAHSKSFKEKKKGLLMAEFIKCEFAKFPFIKPYHLCWSLLYFTDQEFCLKMVLNYPPRLQASFLGSLVPGIVRTENSLFHLRHLIDNLAAPQLALLEGKIQKIVVEHLSCPDPPLKCSLYLFEKFQHILNQLSTIDSILTSAIKNNNHLLLHILLHRTHIRLIKPQSPQHEQQILNHVQHQMKSSKFLDSCTYFLFYPDFSHVEPHIDEKIYFLPQPTLSFDFDIRIDKHIDNIFSKNDLICKIIKNSRK